MYQALFFLQSNEKNFRVDSAGASDVVDHLRRTDVWQRRHRRTLAIFADLLELFRNVVAKTGWAAIVCTTNRNLALKETLNLCNRHCAEVVENTVAGISTAYYRLILELQRLKVLQQTLFLSKARLDISQAQYELGGAGKRDFLAAQVDYNGDSSLLMTQYQVIQNARVNLNELLAADPDTNFLIQDSTITIGDRLALETLYESAFLENKLLLVNQRNNNEAFLRIKELQASRLPGINLNSSFNNSVFNSDAGFLIQNERQGLNYGGTITFNLFSGLTLNRRIQSAKVNQRIQDYSLEQYEIQLKSDIQRAYNTYENNLGLLSIEQTNYQVAKENSEIALERFRLGIASYLEFRDAQVNLLSAENRLITSIFQIKQQEIELLRLSGKIFFTSSLDTFEVPTN